MTLLRHPAPAGAVVTARAYSGNKYAPTSQTVLAVTATADAQGWASLTLPDPGSRRTYWTLTRPGADPVVVAVPRGQGTVDSPAVQLGTLGPASDLVDTRQPSAQVSPADLAALHDTDPEREGFIPARLSDAALKADFDARYAPIGGTDGQTKSDLRALACFGDSMTQGNQDGSGYSWPGLLGTALGTTVTVLNAGQSGWTSTEVAIRQGGMTVTLGAFTIPADTSQVAVSVLAPTGAYRAPSVNVYPAWKGTLAGVTGWLRHHIDAAYATPGQWTFERATAAGGTTAVPAGSVFQGTEYDTHRGDLAIIGVGRNNITDPAIVVRDVDAMIARLSPDVKRYLVLAVTTSSGETSGTTAYGQIKAINDALAAKYGARYLDVRAYLISNGLADNGITPLAADNTAIAGDTIPPSLLFTDGLHPNKYGYKAMATAILARLRLLDWLADPPGLVPTIAVTAPAPTQQWKASSLAGADGTAVAAWAPTVGSTSLVQATGTLQPTILTVGGVKYVSFDGVDDMLRGSPIGATQPATVFVRAKIRAFGSKWHGLVWSETSPGFTIAVQANGTPKIGATANFDGPPAAVTAGTDFILAATMNGASSAAKVGAGNKVTGDVGAGGLSIMRVGYAFTGSAVYAAADIAEIRVYNYALSDAEVAAVIAAM